MRIEFTIAAISCTRYDLDVPIIGKKPDFELYYPYKQRRIIVLELVI